MGMYDEIICSYPLPVVEGDQGELSGHDWSKEIFQTKDLDNTLDRFEITAKGELVYSGYLSARVVGDTWKRIGSESRFHGDIQFYTTIFGTEYDYTVEYEARFSNGQLDRVQLLQWKETSNKDRIAANKEFEKKLLEEQKRKKKIMYRFYTLCRNIRKKIRSIGFK